MKTQAIQYPESHGGFRLPLVGSELIRTGATDAKIGFLVNKENAIVQTAFGTNLKIRFFKIIKRASSAFCNFVARSQLGDQTAQFIRSESGQWQCHPDYIQETIEREKMRNYDFRRG